MLINKLYRKGKARKTVWMLGTNPINGLIKPTDVGYEKNCPWDSELTESYKSNYTTIVLEKLTDQALSVSKRLFTLSLTGGSPWKDTTSPAPRCYRHIQFSIENELTETLYRVTTVHHDDFDRVAGELTYIPDPMLPYQSRQEMRHRRVASVMESLLNYNGNTTLFQSGW
jgi:hypothetical protein